MAKIIVTHLNPDLDAMTAVWLLKRFGGGEFNEAEVEFLPAGETYKNERIDSDENVIHVDTGLGRFDHHQTDKRTCAARLVFEWLGMEKEKVARDEALSRMVALVEEIDFEAGDLMYPQPDNDRYAFLFNERQIIGGWYRKLPGQSDKMMEMGMVVLDGVYEGLVEKVKAEKVFEEALEFETKWGKGIGAETYIRGFLPLAFARGYKIGVTKDPKGGNVRIKGFGPPQGSGQAQVDLTEVYEAVKKKDPEADWFFHASRKMLLNGSRVNPKMKASKLKIAEVMEILKK